MVLHAKKRLINSVWTVSYRMVDDKKVEILSYSRRDPIGYKLEKVLDDGTIIETDERIADKLVVMDNRQFMSDPKKNVREYEIVNKQYIFSYGE